MDKMYTRTECNCHKVIIMYAMYIVGKKKTENLQAKLYIIQRRVRLAITEVITPPIAAKEGDYTSPYLSGV